MALHNYIYLKHHVGVGLNDYKIARDHDPRPVAINKDEIDVIEDGIIHNGNKHDHDHHDHNSNNGIIYINVDNSGVNNSNNNNNNNNNSEVHEESFEDSSDSDFIKKHHKNRSNSNNGQGLTTASNHHNHYHPSFDTTIIEKDEKKDEALNNSIINSNSHLCIDTNNEDRIDIDNSNILQPLFTPSNNNKFKDSKWVIIDGKKKKLKSRFSKNQSRANNLK